MILLSQTSVVRAWDPAKPMLYCPAMNTMMWAQSHTTHHREELTKLGYIEVPPVSKVLACGDEGMGIVYIVVNDLF